MIKVETKEQVGASLSNAWLGHRSQEERPDANESHDGECLEKPMDIESQAAPRWKG